MAFYNQQPGHGRQTSYDHSSQSGWPMEESLQREYNGSMQDSVTGSAQPPVDMPAFRLQFEEVDRAHDNLAKGARPAMQPMHGRRESQPMMGGQFANQFPSDRMGPPPRQYPMHDYDGMRSSPSASGLQGYLANQRFGPPRQTEAESMMQAKRRAAAQREKDLRNYHQEQQYNRTSDKGSAAKSDRSMSPNTMNEEDRRELIARQHKALYGESSNLYNGQPPRPVSQDVRVLAAAASGHGPSPHAAFDAFGHPPATSTDGGAPVPTSAQGSRSRSNSTVPKESSQTSFAMFDNNRPSSSSPSDPPGSQHGTQGAGSIGLIGGSRGLGSQGNRKTPPMPSPLGHGAASNGVSNTGAERHGGSMSWGAGGGPWGPPKQSLDQTFRSSKMRSKPRMSYKSKE